MVRPNGNFSLIFFCGNYICFLCVSRRCEKNWIRWIRTATSGDTRILITLYFMAEAGYYLSYLLAWGYDSDKKKRKSYCWARERSSPKVAGIKKDSDTERSFIKQYIGNWAMSWNNCKIVRFNSTIGPLQEFMSNMSNKFESRKWVINSLRYAICDVAFAFARNHF